MTVEPNYLWLVVTRQAANPTIDSLWINSSQMGIETHYQQIQFSLTSLSKYPPKIKSPFLLLAIPEDDYCAILTPVVSLSRKQVFRNSQVCGAAQYKLIGRMLYSPEIGRTLAR